MFHNYLITALRNFSRHKLYSFINIAGLTVGLTCAIFIILFVRDQLSYDRWIRTPRLFIAWRARQIFRAKHPATGRESAFPLTQAMLEQIPEVKQRARLIPRAVTILIGNREFSETMDVVDPDFLNVIRLPLVAGNQASALAQSNSVIISESTARRYFGNSDAMGRTIIMSAEYCDESGLNCLLKREPLLVTGLLRDLPHDTQLAATLLMPDTSNAAPITAELRTNWEWTSGFGYVKLTSGANVAAVTQKLRTLLDRAWSMPISRQTFLCAAASFSLRTLRHFSTTISRPTNIAA